MGEEATKPPHFTVAGQCTKIHGGRFLASQGQAERGCQATCPRASFTKDIAAGLCPQARPPGLGRQQRCSQVVGVFISRTLLRTLPRAFCGTHVRPGADRMKPHVHLVLQTPVPVPTLGGLTAAHVRLLPTASPSPQKLMPLLLSQQPCTC